MKNSFDKKDAQEFIDRINKLTLTTLPKWGKISVAQMLAHCNVTYELIYDEKHPKPSFITKLFLTLLVKKTVTNEKPYKKNSATGPQFLIKSDKDFAVEKQRLIAYINKTQELGEVYFVNKESHSFGVLSKTEWNNMLSKHLDHHLSQFGV